ncbi:ABC transporter substrate-binding protein [Phytoactinopolyspora mesophila]|uniref:Extracellular solute-binding protein n=1 Tax=Phytoactinopolyspora mesophila TaxID=2650750 RepID=A0A7K3M7W4_9ACTN|nr:ABC transporter substrate-binding protein [Phytoactinopolyspora mesophila]NDL59042.1 extracellular solute-binding protein [Phytoactinopolyspora mesophila]
MRTRPASAVAAISALALLIAACGSDDGESALEEATADNPIEITMYYPIAVGGPLQDVVDGLIDDFESENPEISVQAVYSGNYDETIVAVQTAVDGGDAPVTSVLLSSDMFQLIDDDMIVPFDDVVSTDEERAWLDSFYDAFMANSRDPEGRTWGIPFQRSTIVQYWNKDLFEEAGLDPDHAPQTWDEMIEIAEQVQAETDARWGVQMPSSGFPYWLFQAFTTQNDVEIVSADGTEVYLDQPQVIEALEFWLSLSQDHGVHPPGIVDWGTTPEDFLQEQVAMIWTTTGNLTNVRDNASFDFGVDMLPEGVRRGSPTGGGNFFLFADASEAEQIAAMRLIRFLTQPEQAAEWGIATGYVAPLPEAWETEAMQEYVADFPEAAVARDQLEYAVRELTTYARGQIYEIVTDALQGAIVGDTTAEEAMRHAQEQADNVLGPYQN